MVFQTTTYASLVSALPKSISDKRAAKTENLSLKSFFLDFGTTVRRTFPSSDLQCLPVAIPELFAQMQGPILITKGQDQVALSFPLLA